MERTAEMVEGLAASDFFRLEGDLFADLFVAGEPVWRGIARLPEIVAAAAAGAGAPSIDGAWFQGDVLLGVGVTIEPGVYVQGPTVIGDGATLRQGAYLRGGCLLGAGALVGHCSELKNAALFPGAHAPHFNYVGDSLVGRDVNLGAGTVLSNFKLAGDQVSVVIDGERLPSGLRKFGAVLGDGCQTGCHTVLNPGCVAQPGCRFYPGVVAGGFFRAGSCIKAPIVWGRQRSIGECNG